MIKDKLKLVPHLPGSYQMLDKNGRIIYIGKAKDLNKRLHSYFNRPVTGKTAIMVQEIEDFTYIVANSELESFIMEINLIKKHNPKYNILLKDDKSYPYIEYINKPYPKLKIARYLKLQKKEKKILFGPYPNAYAARRIVKLLNRIYPLKKCEGMPKKTCLYNDIGECLGYCTKNINQKELEQMEAEILAFLKGNEKIIKAKIIEKMKKNSAALNFEVANELKQELNYINILMTKQKVQLKDLINRDVINYYYDKGFFGITVFFLRNGKLVGHYNENFPLLEDIKEELEYFIVRFYEKKEHPQEVIIPTLLDSKLLNQITTLKFIVPTKGEKKKLLDMVSLNAKIALENNLSLLEKDLIQTQEANENLRQLLNLTSLNRIEVFDNSNLFGTFTVSAMVVFEHGKPNKKEYRKYKISLDKNDDYQAMKEVIYRRYYRVLSEKSSLPDLIIVDGGINQINACKSVLEDLNLKIKVCGLKKNDKHRTNDLIDGDNYQVILFDRPSSVFHYLANIQEEVHRFTINYHRQIRSKGQIASLLDKVEGIGPKRRKELLTKYGSLAKIKEASLEELTKIIPQQTALNLQQFIKEFKQKI